MPIPASDMTPAWPPFASPGGLWFNTTDIDAAGQVLAGGTFTFDTTADFGMYLFNSGGTLIRSDIWSGATDGVFWVRVSADGSVAAAGGWQSMSPAYVGRLRAIKVADGSVLVDQSTGSRVNQIALTGEGRWLAAGCGATYSSAGQQIYFYELVDGVYQARTGYTNSGQSVQTLAMSADGAWIVAGLYGATSLVLFQNTGNGLVAVQSWTIPPTAVAGDAEAFDVRGTVRAHRAALEQRSALGAEAASGSSGGYVKSVSITPDGSKFAAALSGQGGLAMFDREAFIQSGNAAWTYVQPGISTSSIVTISADGSFAVMGSNGHDMDIGLVYRVNDAGASGSLAWATDIAYWPNPCNHMLGGEDNLVACGSGEPNGSVLTPGAFHVLDATNGGILGRYDTSQMNWPFQLSASGTFAVGGSDDGHLYGFDARGNWGNAI